MKYSLWFLALPLTLLVFSGCQDEADRRPAGASPAAPAAAGPAPAEAPAVDRDSPSGLTKEFLMNQKFVLVRVDDIAYAGGPDQKFPAPTLEFDDGFVVSGRICNNYRGLGELLGDVLTVRAVASTRMLCPDQNLNQLETRFFQMLESGATLSMDGDLLYLKRGDGVLTFKAKTGLD